MPRWATTKSNIEERYDQFWLDDVPPTSTDAIQVALRLDIQYIWVDSLCIIQDSKRDWRREASRMADVYSKAYFTIFADGRPGEDDRVGTAFSTLVLFWHHCLFLFTKPSVVA